MVKDFVDLIIEKRTSYIENIKERIKRILSLNPLDNLRKLMFVSSTTESLEEIIDEFIEKARNNDYFKNLYEKIRGKEFTWNNLKEIDEIGGILEIYHDTIMGKLQQVSSVIDKIYAPFLEPLKSMPLVYSSGEYPEGFGLEPNCLGVCQIITVLYSFNHDINDLRFLEIYSSKRREKLLEKLKELNESKSMLSCSDFDTFFGSFETDDLRNMVFDQVLSLEESTHGVIKNKKENEIYDYKIEKENYKGILESDIREGLFYSTFANLIQLMTNLDYDNELIKEVFSEYYKDYKESVLMNSVGLSLYIMDDDKAREFLNKIKDIYKTIEDLPAKYIVMEIILDSNYIYNKEVREKIKKNLDFLKRKYILDNALKHISERYCKNEILVDLDKYALLTIN